MHLEKPRDNYDTGARVTSAEQELFGGWRLAFDVYPRPPMLPISVLVPARNSMSLLPKHLEAMRPWLDLAEEVVAVDSDSNDGTVELLQRELKHSNFRLLRHPPGLYQSWNFGIAQCRAKYVYISTVGETITREGLAKLCASAEQFAAQVVISPPRMVKISGETKHKTWPVHSIIKDLRLTDPIALEGAAAQLFAVIHLLRGILGSSASNLYRSEILQRLPFRTDFGTAGDLAWGLEHAGEIRLAIVPENFSTFVFHPKSYAKSDYAVEEFNEKCLAVAGEAVRRRPWNKAGSLDAGTESDVEREQRQLADAWDKYLRAKRKVAAAKSSPVWWLSPRAWGAHRLRRGALQKLTELQRGATQILGSYTIHG